MGQESADIHFGRYQVTPQTIVRPSFADFRPRYTVIPAVLDDLRAIERADQELSRFRFDRVQARRLLEEALTRNTFATASIEGNPMTLEEVESLLARAPSAHDVPATEREILNMAEFLERLETARPPATPDDVAALHARLFAGVLPDAGEFKQQPNFIGQRPSYVVTFVPARPERVVPELRNLFAWYETAAEHPLVKAFILFHETQGIHPFRDGNGRIGRAILANQLHANGYPGVRYALIDYAFNEDRDAYYGNLVEVERNDWDFTSWIGFMARVVRATFEDAVQRFLLHERLARDLNDRQWRLAQWFARLDRARPGQDVKFNDVHAAFPHIAERTLKRDLATLREAGAVRMEGERKGARYRFIGRPDSAAQ